MNKTKMALAALGFALAGAAQASIVVHTTDFIADGDRTSFNGFESIPMDELQVYSGGAVYTEGGITVEQVNSDGGNSIWVTYLPAGTQGAHAWYPNGGDQGYTKITLANNADFNSVGFGVGSGGGASAVKYELYNDGNLVLSGSSSMATHYLGFSGGGFDAIYLADNYSVGSVTGGGLQALVVDSIETVAAEGTVPEPATLAIFGTAALGMAIARRRKQAK